MDLQSFGTGVSVGVILFCLLYLSIRESGLTKRPPDGYNEPPEKVIPPKRVPPAPPSIKNSRR